MGIQKPAEFPPPLFPSPTRGEATLDRPLELNCPGPRLQTAPSPNLTTREACIQTTGLLQSCLRSAMSLAAEKDYRTVVADGQGLAGSAAHDHCRRPIARRAHFRTLPCRTPRRVAHTGETSALVRLEEEGFLDAFPSGGFAVKAFSARDVFDAIETRGVLEGLAARLAAERGVRTADLAPLRAILTEIDAVIAPEQIEADAFSDYVRLNAQFHTLLSALAGSKPLIRQIERAAALPFASPSGFVLSQSVMTRPQRMLIIANDHHHAIIEAIELREGERAEAVTREHARLAARNLRHALKTQSAMDLVPGHALIRQTERALNCRTLINLGRTTC